MCVVQTDSLIVLQRRKIGAQREQARRHAQLARDHAMATILSRVYRGHIARMILRYTRQHAARQRRLQVVPVCALLPILHGQMSIY